MTDKAIDAEDAEDAECPDCGRGFDADDWFEVGHVGDAFGRTAYHACPTDGCPGEIQLHYR